MSMYYLGTTQLDDPNNIVQTEVCVYPRGPQDETLEYLCFVDVHLYRNVPCDAEITKMYRIEYDQDGLHEISRIELACPFEFPHYIEQEAKRIAVEEW